MVCDCWVFVWLWCVAVGSIYKGGGLSAEPQRPLPNGLPFRITYNVSNKAARQERDSTKRNNKEEKEGRAIHRVLAVWSSVRRWLFGFRRLCAGFVV